MLKELDEATIRRLIKNARKSMGYKKKKHTKTDSHRDFTNLSKKRTSTQARLSDCNPEGMKRQNKGLNRDQGGKPQSIADTLL